MRITEKQIQKIVEESLRQLIKQEDDVDLKKLFNLNAIPDDEMKRQYVDLSGIVSSSGYGGKFMGVNGKILSEEATSTLSLEETKRQMQDKFNLKDWQFATRKGGNGVDLVILYPSIFKNTRLIKNAMEACGWSLARKDFVRHNGMVWRLMDFDPMFQPEM